MSEKEIKDKLITNLISMPENEKDVVYILSRVRKILEIKNYPEDYSILNFYCNLTLHSKITRPPKVIVEKLKELHRGKSPSKAYFELTSKDFHDQLDKFLKECGIPSFYPIGLEDLKKLNNLLLNVWSHTPIRLEYIEAFDITFEQRAEGYILVSGKRVE